MPVSRREFLTATVLAAASLKNATSAEAGNAAADKLHEVGVTTSSFSPHLTARAEPGKFTLLDLPRLMRDELDMRLIDLNTSALASFDGAYLERVRAAAEKAGCLLTNLKLNQSGLDMNSADPAVREKALAEYKRSIDAAERLGVQWARPLPLRARPDMERHIAAYRELADYARPRNVRMLVENYGWMASEADSTAKLIAAVDRNLAACPDTGNWSSNEVRYAGLAKTFPLAVTCDFKAGKLGASGEHAAYDLQKCFQIGWDAGFRGPWCLEHANGDRKQLFRELGVLRDMLRKWIAASA